jgi:AcrR family transcriptional regulator
MTDVLETRPETRRRRKAERPQEIVEAAFTEFSRNGYAVTTLDQIAERAGVTKGTIYVYFENKEQLFISMVHEAMKASLDTIHEMFERHEGSTADLLRAQFSFIYQHLVEDRRRREVVRMLIAEASRFRRSPTATTRKFTSLAWTCCRGSFSAASIAAKSAARS